MTATVDHQDQSINRLLCQSNTRASHKYVKCYGAATDPSALLLTGMSLFSTLVCELSARCWVSGPLVLKALYIKGAILID